LRFNVGFLVYYLFEKQREESERRGEERRGEERRETRQTTRECVGVSVQFK